MNKGDDTGFKDRFDNPIYVGDVLAFAVALGRGQECVTRTAMEVTDKGKLRVTKDTKYSWESGTSIMQYPDRTINMTKYAKDNGGINVDLAGYEPTLEQYEIVAKLMTDTYMDRVDLLNRYIKDKLGHDLSEYSNDVLRGILNE